MAAHRRHHGDRPARITDKILLAWDTRNPDPARWPVITITTADTEPFPGTLTELYVAELTSTGPGLASFSPGNPATRAWPVRGPDTPRES